jgi:hypothetical protein
MEEVGYLVFRVSLPPVKRGGYGLGWLGCVKAKENLNPFASTSPGPPKHQLVGQVPKRVKVVTLNRFIIAFTPVFLLLNGHFVPIFFFFESSALYGDRIVDHVLRLGSLAPCGRLSR